MVGWSDGRMVSWSDGQMVGWSNRRMIIPHSAFCILHCFGQMVVWAVLLALLAGPWCVGAEAPGPETHLFRAELPNREMAVFLPERDISSPEDAAAYLRWARETHPAWAGRIRAVWTSDPVALPVHWQNEAAFLREGDSAVDSAGAIRFRVAGLPENGRFRVRLETDPAAGTATPKLCLTNIWVLSRDDLFARWRKALADNPDTAPAEVRGQIEVLTTSGRYARRGGAIWEAAVEDFRTNTPALWPRIRFENRTDVAVVVVCQGATITIPPSAARTVIVKDPANEIPWVARLIPLPPFVAEDYEWTTNSLPWRRSASSDSVHVFDTPPGVLKPPPTIDLKFEGFGQPIPSDLRVSIRYKDGKEETITAYVTNGVPRIQVRPRVAMSAILFACDANWRSWDDGEEPILGCDEQRSMTVSATVKRKPSPAAQAAPSKSVSDHQAARPSDQPTTRPPDQPTTRPADHPTTQPSDHPTIGRSDDSTIRSSETHPIVRWPETVRETSVPAWPWMSLTRQQIRIGAWWDDWLAIDTGQKKDDYDRTVALKKFDSLLQGQDDKGEFRRAYIHVAACKGCDNCRAHRRATSAVNGFEEQRWALFQSLLLNSEADWTDFKEPPTAERIKMLRKLLEEQREKRK